MTKPSLYDWTDEKEPIKENLEFQKCKQFGVPYMGSKNQIVKKLIEQLPSAKYFIDLFAGGCSMTHGAILSKKYNHFIVNDIDDAPSLFLDAINGKFKNETRWISRDDFFALKDKEPYVRYCWSFGNNGKGYLYSKEIEPYKKAYHFARFENFSFFDEFAPYVKNEYVENLRAYITKNKDIIKADYVRWYLETQLGIKGEELEKATNATKNDIENESERLRAYLRDALKSSGLTQSVVSKYLDSQMAKHYFSKSQWQFPTFEEYKKMQEILPLNKSYFECVNFLDVLGETLQNLQSLQSLERLQRLESLESLENLEIYQGCYNEVELPNSNDCVIYLDPPYKDTASYLSGSFNHNEFYDWCIEKAKQGYKIFISEYDMPSDRFKSIFNVDKIQQLSGTGAGKIKQEHLFVPII